jgi:hypothetical protein
MATVAKEGDVKRMAGILESALGCGGGATNESADGGRDFGRAIAADDADSGGYGSGR